MRRFLAAVALACGAILLSPVAGAQGSSLPGAELPEVNRAVDLERYSGTWYQVAALPQPYTLQCAHHTTAEYGVVDAQTISVRNSCGTLLGPRSTIEGTATAVSDASLRVTFPGVPFQQVDGPPNYRVTHLEEDYSLAVVGDPRRLSGFVLSRTPDLSPGEWSRVRGIVESRGWNSCTFLTVPMPGGRGDVAPLCVL
ncbi:lipocalin family protein [Corynebacterium nasicanis]|uniref:Lipocalin family protein n=1 Tax=Corynebacterium nasicanis TaxID=1448267 RepID=A0ABW1QC56_9CORY